MQSLDLTCTRVTRRMEKLSADTKNDLEQNRQDLEKAIGRCRAQLLVTERMHGLTGEVKDIKEDQARTICFGESTWTYVDLGCLLS